MTKTYTGSCHCGDVRFEVDLDLSRGTYRCNCSFCSKLRTWIAMLEPGSLRVLSGEEKLSDYQFGRRQIHHTFCSRCGIHPFGWMTDPKGSERRYVVSLGCLDDISDQELADTPVTYTDGRNDDWQSPPAETRYL